MMGNKQHYYNHYMDMKDSLMDYVSVDDPIYWHQEAVIRLLSCGSRS